MCFRGALMVRWSISLVVFGISVYGAYWSGSALARKQPIQSAQPQVSRGDRGAVETPLVPSPNRLDFGTLPRGGRAELAFVLSNPGIKETEVAEVQTSCGCFRVALEERTVKPGDQVTATAIIDLSEDPEFDGSLRLSATGFATDKRTVAFVIYADVKLLRQAW